MPSTSKLLNDSHLASMKNALDILTQAQSEITLAKQAGIDVTQMQANLDAQRQTLLQLKNTYFPGQ